jgi:flagellin
MQSEVGNLTAQISDVLNNTLFNGNNVFKVMTSTPATDGSDDLTLDIQAGANTTNVVTLRSVAFDGQILFGSGAATYDAASTTQALDVSDRQGFDHDGQHRLRAGAGDGRAPNSAPARTACNRWSTT